MSILLLFIFVAAIPLAAFILVAYSLISFYNQELAAIKSEAFPHKYLGDRFYGQFMVLTAYAAPPFIYGFLVFTLIILNRSIIDSSIMENLALAACLALGMSSTLAIIAHQPIVKAAIKDMIWRSGPPKEIKELEKINKWVSEHGGSPFSKYMILCMNVQLAPIFGLLFAILLMVGSGIIPDDAGGETTEETTIIKEPIDRLNLTVVDSETFIQGGVMLGIFSSGTLLYTFLIQRVEGDLLEGDVFKKKCIYGSPGIILQIIGLVIGIYYILPILS